MSAAAIRVSQNGASRLSGHRLAPRLGRLVPDRPLVVRADTGVVHQDADRARARAASRRPRARTPPRLRARPRRTSPPISSAAARTSGSERATTLTAAPSAASAFAIARPIPRPPPVTSATLPSSPRAAAHACASVRSSIPPSTGSATPVIIRALVRKQPQHGVGHLVGCDETLDQLVGRPAADRLRPRKAGDLDLRSRTWACPPSRGRLRSRGCRRRRARSRASASARSRRAWRRCRRAAPAYPRRPEIDDTSTIAPPCERICGIAALAVWKTPVRFTVSTCDHSRRLELRNGCHRPQDAGVCDDRVDGSQLAARIASAAALSPPSRRRPPSWPPPRRLRRGCPRRPARRVAVDVEARHPRPGTAPAAQRGGRPCRRRRP